MREAILCVGVAQRGTGAASSAAPITRITATQSADAMQSIGSFEIDVLSATRRIRPVVASDDSSVCTLLAGAVGPSGGGRGSYLKATDGLFAEEFEDRR